MNPHISETGNEAADDSHPSEAAQVKWECKQAQHAGEQMQVHKLLHHQTLRIKIVG